MRMIKQHVRNDVRLSDDALFVRTGDSPGAANGPLCQHLDRPLDVASDASHGTLALRLEVVENVALVQGQPQRGPEDAPHTAVLLADDLSAAVALGGALDRHVDHAHCLVMRDAFACAPFLEGDLQLLNEFDLAVDSCLQRRVGDEGSRAPSRRRHGVELAQRLGSETHMENGRPACL